MTRAQVAGVVAVAVLTACGGAERSGVPVTRATTTSAPAPTGAPTTTTTPSTVAPSSSTTSTVTLPPSAAAWDVLPFPPGRLDAFAVMGMGSTVVVWDQSAVPYTFLRWDDVQRTWRALPDAGFDLAWPVVWTGRELVLLGGTAEGDGEARRVVDVAFRAFDPATDTWRPYATVAPEHAPYLGPGLWTGTEILWLSAYGLATPTAYDPATDTWRSLARPPAPFQCGAVAWADGEAIVRCDDAGGADPGTRLFRYDPAADRWRAIAPWPVSIAPSDVGWQHVVWTGDRVIVWGAQLIAGAGTLPYGGSYDPRTDTWRALPGAPSFVTVSSAAAWSGTDLVVVGGCYPHPTDQTRPLMPPVQAAAFDPTSGAWRQLIGFPDVTTSPPLDRPLPLVQRCGGQAFPIGGGAMLVFGGYAVPPDGPSVVRLPPFVLRAAG